MQIPANLGNLGVKLRQQITASDVVIKGIGDGHPQKENSHATEDKIKDFIQKGINKKFQEVGYQFSSILSLLPRVLIKSRELRTCRNDVWYYCNRVLIGLNLNFDTILTYKRSFF